MIPPLPRHFKRGDALTATAFNQLIDAVRSTIPLPGEGVRVSYTGGGAKIDVKNKVRQSASVDDGHWLVKYDDEHSCWAVHIAHEAVVGISTNILNEHVGGDDDEEQTETDWYKIVSAPNGNAEGTFAVNVHIKRRVVTGEDVSEIGGAVIVTATEIGEGDFPGDEDSANLSAGDIFFARIAVCTTTAETEDGVTVYTHKVKRELRSQVQLEYASPSVFELYWKLTEGTASTPPTFTPHVPGIPRDAPICGGSVEDTELPDDGDATVWYLIDCTGDSPVPSIETEREEEDADGLIYVKIYGLSDGRVVSDERIKLNTLVFYP